jgi:hypothetical protein
MADDFYQTIYSSPAMRFLFRERLRVRNKPDIKAR